MKIIKQRLLKKIKEQQKAKILSAPIEFAHITYSEAHAQYLIRTTRSARKVA